MHPDTAIGTRPSLTTPCAAKLLGVIAAATATLLAGCATTAVTDVSSRYYQLPDSTTVIVRQAITIPPGTAHVILQDARIVAADRLRRYEPFCEIEVNDLRETEQQVRPGRFTVTRIVRQQIMGADRQPVRLAANTAADGEQAVVAESGSAVLVAIDTPMALNEIHLKLQSAEQPNVRELRCAGGWAFLPDPAYPTLAEMNGALGGFASIEVR